MLRKTGLLSIAAMLVTSACGNSEDPADMTMQNIRDVRVPIPETTSAYVDFVGPDTIIGPGADKMTCLHVLYDGEDLAYTLADTQQGKFGHHAVILKAKMPLPSGSVEDCSKPEDMTKYDLITIPGNEVPDGYGLFMPKNTPLVVQSHYLNSSQQSLRVRDVVRLRKATQAVTTWAAPFAVNTSKFEVPASNTGTTTFDCQLPVDGKLMLILGHMHANGTRFEAQLGADANSVKEIYKVDTWNADYRDNPPVTLLWKNPMPVSKGDIVRTTCEWLNPTTHAMSYPEEMCSTVGILAGIKTPFGCNFGSP